jgi:hypothetical protein
MILEEVFCGLRWVASQTTLNYTTLTTLHYAVQALRMYSDYQNCQAYQLPNATVTYYISLRTALLRSSAVRQLVNHKRGRSVSRVANSIPARRQSNGEKNWEDPPNPESHPRRRRLTRDPLPIEPHNWALGA